MNKNPNNKVSVSKAFKEAWKGFSGWWIPLCIVSAIILFSQSWLPKLLIKNFEEYKTVNVYIEFAEECKSEIMNGSDPLKSVDKMMRSITDHSGKPSTKKSTWILVQKVVLTFSLIFIFVSVLHIIIILMSKASIEKSCKDEIKSKIKKAPYLTISYLILSLLKVAPGIIALFLPMLVILISGPALFNCGSLASILLILISFFLAFILLIFAAFLYVKLYFTGFIITDENVNPLKSIPQSWKLTKGIFWKTAFVFLITVIIDLLSIITMMLSFIPGTSFKYTLRAALYKQVK